MVLVLDHEDSVARGVLWHGSKGQLLDHKALGHEMGVLYKIWRNAHFRCHNSLNEWPLRQKKRCAKAWRNACLAQRSQVRHQVLNHAGLVRIVGVTTPQPAWRMGSLVILEILLTNASQSCGIMVSYIFCQHQSVDIITLRL
jgi:hypothetical protein